MNLESLLTKVLPTMLQSWVVLALFIVFVISSRRFGGLIYKVIEPIIVPGKGQKRDREPFSFGEMTSNWYQRLASASETFLTEHARSLDAPYQTADDFLRQRFK